jgi:hypothetical protein
MNEAEIIVLAAFGGALASGLMGWAEAHERFDIHKFMGTIFRAAFAAISFGYTTQYVKVEGLVWVYAFLGGAGVDVLGNRLQGAAKGKGPTVDDKLDAITALLNKPPADTPPP